MAFDLPEVEVSQFDRDKHSSVVDASTAQPLPKDAKAVKGMTQSLLH